jgi:hypothetical protein
MGWGFYLQLLCGQQPFFFGARFRIVMKFRKKQCYKFNDFEKNAKIWAKTKKKKKKNKKTRKQK